MSQCKRVHGYQVINGTLYRIKNGKWSGFSEAHGWYEMHTRNLSKGKTKANMMLMIEEVAGRGLFELNRETLKRVALSI